MNTRTGRMLSLIGCVAGVLISADAARSADWPQWRGANGDARVSDFNAPQTWPKELKQTWSVTVGAGDATPALVGDKLYVFTREGANEVIRCLDANTGKTLWEDKYEPGVSVTGPASPHPGPRSSPAVGDGKVITIGVSGILSCLDAESGKVLWRKDPYKSWPKFYTGSSPIIVDKLCIAQLGGQGAGAVLAIDLANGEPKWTAQTDSPAYATPAVMSVDGAKQVVAQTERTLIGLSFADGKQLWSIPTPAQRMAQNAVTPVIDGDVVIYSGQGTGTRAVRIEKSADGYKPADLWTNAEISSGFATPVLKDGLLFGLSNKASFFCLDAKTGKTLWSSPPRPRERGFGALVDAGNVILALTPGADLIVFKPSGTQFEQVASIKVPDKQPYAYPVISGNRVFIKGQDTLTAFSIE